MSADEVDAYPASASTGGPALRDARQHAVLVGPLAHVQIGVGQERGFERRVDGVCCTHIFLPVTVAPLRHLHGAECMRQRLQFARDFRPQQDVDLALVRLRGERAPCRATNAGGPARPPRHH